MTSGVRTAPKCSCGQTMVPIAGHEKFFACPHCDGPCHKRCNADADCDNGGGKCVVCNAFDIGSRPKRAANWYPKRSAE